MKLDSVLSLKKEILDEHYKTHLRADPGLRATSLPVTGGPQERLGVGYSVRGKKDYLLELRVQRRGGRAYNYANQVRERVGGEANVAIIKRVEVPSKTAVASAVRGQSEAAYASMRRPLQIGLSVGHLDGAPGTLGAFVEANEGEAILSNSHVLALAGGAERNAVVYQPGKPDEPRLRAFHQVGRLRDFIAISKAGANDVDAAYAVLENGIHHEGNTIPSDSNSPDIGKKLTLAVNYDAIGAEQRVGKVGRTTGYTEGAVTGIAIDDVVVGLATLGNVRFDNLLEIRWDAFDKPFADFGDSGSLVYLLGSLEPVGLQFASGVLEVGGKEVGFSYACNLTTVLEALTLELIA